jgi:hypothetical protein
MVEMLCSTQGSKNELETEVTFAVDGHGCLASCLTSFFEFRCEDKEINLYLILDNSHHKKYKDTMSV